MHDCALDGRRRSPDQKRLQGDGMSHPSVCAQKPAGVPQLLKLDQGGRASRRSCALEEFLKRRLVFGLTPRAVPPGLV